MPASTTAPSGSGGWGLILGSGGVIVVLFLLRHVLLPFIVAAALAFLLTPAVDLIHRRLRLPRWIGAVAVYLCVVAAAGCLAFFVARFLTREGLPEIRAFPQVLHKLVGDLAAPAGTIIGYPIDADAVTRDILDEGRRLLGTATLMSFAGYGVAGVLGAILVVVLLLYFLISGREIAAGLLWLVPPRFRAAAGSMAGKIVPLLERYFLGLLAVVAYTATVAWIGLGLVLHLPLAPFLALAMGVLELVPLIGPATSMVLVALTAARSADLATILGGMGLAVALRLSIDQAVGPLVLGKVARLHPVAVLFSFLAGAVLFGVVGVILAVPVAASIKMILAACYDDANPDRGVEDHSLT